MYLLAERAASPEGPEMTEQTIEPAEIRVGDLGYYGDREGAYVVSGLDERGINLQHESGFSERIPRAEAEDQNWLWYPREAGLL
jgi:hypothetical protein